MLSSLRLHILPFRWDLLLLVVVQAAGDLLYGRIKPLFCLGAVMLVLRRNAPLDSSPGPEAAEQLCRPVLMLPC